MATINYFFRHEVAEKVREEGREEGREEARAQERATMILRTLVWRGIQIPDAERERVLSTTDLDQLAAWLDRSYQVTDAQELFAEES